MNHRLRMIIAEYGRDEDCAERVLDAFWETHPEATAAVSLYTETGTLSITTSVSADNAYDAWQTGYEIYMDALNASRSRADRDRRAEVLSHPGWRGRVPRRRLRARTRGLEPSSRFRSSPRLGPTGDRYCGGAGGGGPTQVSGGVTPERKHARPKGRHPLTVGRPRRPQDTSHAVLHGRVSQALLGASRAGRVA